MRTPLVAGNWKMNGDRAMAQSLCAGIVEGAAGIENVDIALCPPYTLLGVVAGAIEGSRCILGAQDMDINDNGAFTGQVSASMLSDWLQDSPSSSEYRTHERMSVPFVSSICQGHGDASGSSMRFDGPLVRRTTLLFRRTWRPGAGGEIRLGADHRPASPVPSRSSFSQMIIPVQVSSMLDRCLQKQARRPSFSVLDCSSTCAALDMNQTPWRENLRVMLKGMVT